MWRVQNADSPSEAKNRNGTVQIYFVCLSTDEIDYVKYKVVVSVQIGLYLRQIDR